MFKIQNVGKKGLGVIAKQNFPEMFEVIEENALVSLRMDEFSLETLETQVNRLSEKEQSFFHSLVGKTLEEKFRFNSLGIHKTVISREHKTMGIFPTIARLNHSCQPNCMSAADPEKGTMTLTTLFPVKKDDELTISYLEGIQAALGGFAERQNELKSVQRFGFTCECPLCILPEDERAKSDDRRRNIQKLKRSCITNCTPKEVQKLFGLLTKESLHTSILGNDFLFAMMSMQSGERSRESRVSKEKYIDTLLNALKPSFATESVKVDSMDTHFPLSILKEHARKGSKTAANLVKVKEHWLRAVSYFEAPYNISNEYHRDAIYQLFSCLTAPNGEIICAFTKELYFNFRNAADRLFEENPLDGRIFYVLTFLRALHEGLPSQIDGVKEFLKKSTDHKAELTKLLGIMYQFRSTHGTNADTKLCVKYLTKAIELFGDKVSIDIYFLRASSARMVDKTVKLAIKDYRYYLANAPIDNRSYPEACYGLALTLGHHRYKYKESREMYYKGLEAERQRLPFFGPIKDTIKNLMAMDSWITKPITPAKEKEVKFPKGAKVKLQGLKVKEYNGKVGTVIGCRVNVGGVFRYPVQLASVATPKRVRPENLVLL